MCEAPGVEENDSLGKDSQTETVSYQHSISCSKGSAYYTAIVLPITQMKRIQNSEVVFEGHF